MNAQSEEPVLGVDVGGTHVRRLAWSGEQPVPLPLSDLEKGYEPLIHQVARLRREAESKLNMRFSAIGLGLPGAIEGRRVKWLPNIEGFHDVPLADDLEDALGIPVWLANDGHAALLGEAWKGAAARATSAALLTIGTGLGGAILVGNRIVRGRHGTAGAFGWTSLSSDEPSPANHGEFESRVSGTALNEIGRAMDPPLNSFQIVERARAGLPKYLRILHELGTLLGRGLAVVASTIDPEVLIVTGGLSDAFDLMEDSMRAAYDAFSSPMVRDTPIVRAQLGTTAGAYGAVQLARQRGEVFI